VGVHGGYRSWEQWEQFGVLCDLLDWRVLGGSKSQEIGGDPVEVTVLDSLESLTI
jgi:hypothetical protein